MLSRGATAPSRHAELDPTGVGHDAIGVVDAPLLRREAAAAEQPEAADGAERMLRRFLWLCESPRTRSTMLRLVRASVGSAGAGRRFYRLLNKTVLHPVARATGLHGSAQRLELVAAQLVGLAMMRYVLEVEPVASAPVEDLVMQMAPAIRAALRS
ncbi:MAG: hypothetical protein ACRDPH_03660 [Marmoricola sp.]